VRSFSGIIWIIDFPNKMSIEELIKLMQFSNHLYFPRTTKVVVGVLMKITPMLGTKMSTYFKEKISLLVLICQ
jgi:hypothetical protein